MDDTERYMATINYLDDREPLELVGFVELQVTNKFIIFVWSDQTSEFVPIEGIAGISSMKMREPELLNG